MPLVDDGRAGCPVCGHPTGDCGHGNPHPMVFSQRAAVPDDTWQPAPHDLFERYLTLNRRDWSTRLVCRAGSLVPPATYARCLDHPDGLDDTAERQASADG